MEGRGSKVRQAWVPAFLSGKEQCQGLWEEGVVVVPPPATRSRLTMSLSESRGHPRRDKGGSHTGPGAGGWRLIQLVGLSSRAATGQ